MRTTACVRRHPRKGNDNKVPRSRSRKVSDFPISRGNDKHRWRGQVQPCFSLPYFAGERQPVARDLDCLLGCGIPHSTGERQCAPASVRAGVVSVSPVMGADKKSENQKHGVRQMSSRQAADRKTRTSRKAAGYVSVMCNVPPELVAEMDALRGTTPRSQWLIEQVIAARDLSVDVLVRKAGRPRTRFIENDKASPT